MLHCKSVWHEVSFLANVPESLEENWSKYEWWIKGHLWLFMHMVITMILIFHLLFGKMKTHFRVQMCSFKTSGVYDLMELKWEITYIKPMNTHRVRTRTLRKYSTLVRSVSIHLQDATNRPNDDAHWWLETSAMHKA